jgi:UPF0755 protein
MKKVILYFLTAVLVVALLVSLWGYRTLYGVNVYPLKQQQPVFIPTGSSYQQVLDSITANLNIKNIRVLEWVAMKKDYPSRIKAGKYIIDKGISYNELVNILRSGHQTPVRLTFSNIRTINQLAARAAGKLEADSMKIMDFFTN